jgi:hypothetical protein
MFLESWIVLAEAVGASEGEAAADRKTPYNLIARARARDFNPRRGDCNYLGVGSHSRNRRMLYFLWCENCRRTLQGYEE